MIKNKAKLLFSCLLATVVVAVIGWASGAIFQQTQYDSYLKNANNDLSRAIINSRIILNQLIEQKKGNTLFLAKLPPIQGIIRASRNQNYDKLDTTSLLQWRHRLGSTFKAFMKDRPEILQLRFILKAHDGMEIVRVNRLKDSLDIVPKEKLQQKGGRSYFIKTSKYPKGEVFISMVSFNKERGQLERPLMPTIRFATPIYDKRNRFSAIVIMNVNFQYMLKKITANLAKGLSFYIVNAIGDFVYHQDKSKILNSELNQHFKWQNEYRLVKHYKDIPSLTLYQHDGKSYLGVKQKLVVDGREVGHSLNLYMFFPLSEVLQKLNHAKNQLITLVVLITLFILFIALFFVRIRLHHKQLEAKNVKDINKLLEAKVQEQTQAFNHLFRFQKAILEHAGSMIISTTTDGIITSFNPEAEKQLGYQSSELVNQKTPAIFHDIDEVVERAALFSHELGLKIEPGFDVFVIKSKLNLVNEHKWTYIRKDGSKFPVFLSVSAILDENKNMTGYLGVAFDLTQLEQTQKQLKEAHKQLLQVAKIAQIGMWTWHLSRDTLSWDEQMCEMYDYKPLEESQGIPFAHWKNCILEEDREPFMADITDAIQNKCAYSGYFRIDIPYKGIRHIQIAAYTTYHPNGEPKEMYGVCFDITKQKELEIYLTSAKDSAEKTIKAKTEFVSNITHELRTPMNGILGMLQLLKQTALNEEQSDYVDKASAASNHMLALINQVLDFSKLEAHQVKLEYLAFNIDDLISGVHKIVLTQIDTNNLEFDLKIDKQITKALVGDKIRLQEVIINLCSNAIKFTKKGSIVLSVKEVNSTDDIATLQFSVKDSGIGIKKEKYGAIFDEFNQAEVSTTREYGGTGLGLSICKRIVTQMGGEISVESELNKGSTFTVVIPFAKDKQKEVGIAKEEQPNFSLDCNHILLVEDNLLNQHVAKEIFKKEGIQFEVASNGQEAVDKINQEPEKFNIVLMDIRMPVMDGYQATKVIRETLNRQDIKIIAMTANVNQEEQEHALAAGMNDYLSKPYSIDGLMTMISKYTRHG